MEIEVHTNTDAAGTVAYLDCRRVSYDEIGGEAFNANRHRSRHALEQQTLDELQRLLPTGALATPSSAQSGLDGAMFTLTIGRGANAVEYSWWSPCPAEWECLSAIARILVSTAGVAHYVDL
jgi:hypothetical protein